MDQLKFDLKYMKDTPRRLLEGAPEMFRGYVGGIISGQAG